MKRLAFRLRFPCLIWLLSSGAAGQESGWFPILGGLPLDSGVAAGVEYRAARIGGSPANFLAKAIGSTKRYEFGEAALEFPLLASGFLFTEFQVRYRNYPEEDFWGLGSQARKDLRTTFRLEDAGYSATFGFRPWNSVRTGVIAGILDVNTGPGKDEDHPSIEELFRPADAPGLETQPNYRNFGAFVEMDHRDDRYDPTRGGFYSLRWTHWHDRKLGRFHFRRWEVDVRHFFPSFERRSTVAVRAATTLSETGNSGEVPFFLKPTAGGGNDIRGYHQYRFRDDNSLVLNLEHRWRARDYLQVIAFTDAGRVFSRPGAWGLDHMKTTLGGGARAKLGRRLIVGFDVGWSREGVHFWFRGSQIF